MTLLRIDSSARRSSVSRELTSRFVEAWHAIHPRDRVIERDLAVSALPPITDDWSATYGDPSVLTAAQQQYLSASDALIAELLAADVIVIGAPMYNLTISAELKGWIDQIVRIGKTVTYDASGPRGLLHGKQVVVITSRGGSYPRGTSRGASDFQEPYLRAILTFVGLSDITFVHAEHQQGGALGESSRLAALTRLAEIASRPTAEEIAHHGSLNVH